MDHILVSNIITEKISGASGRELFVLNMDIVNQWTKENNFKLVVILRDKATGEDDKKTFPPHYGGAPSKVSFSSVIVKVPADKDLHFQIESDMPILGDLHYRFF